MLKVYNVLSSLFGKTAAAQNTHAADSRHISKENDITNVLYQNLKHEDAQLRDYIITICFVIQLAAFLAIVSIWCYKKVAALMERMVFKMLARFGPESEITEIMVNIAATTTNKTAADQVITNAQLESPPPLADSCCTSSSSHIFAKKLAIYVLIFPSIKAIVFRSFFGFLSLFFFF